MNVQLSAVGETRSMTTDYELIREITKKWYENDNCIRMVVRQWLADLTEASTNQHWNVPQTQPARRSRIFYYVIKSKDVVHTHTHTHTHGDIGSNTDDWTELCSACNFDLLFANVSAFTAHDICAIIICHLWNSCGLLLSSYGTLRGRQTHKHSACNVSRMYSLLSQLCTVKQ